VRVAVEAEGLARYSQDVEATVYFCVLEGLQNVQKYASATHVVVRLHADGGTLTFSVIDDGTGFDSAVAKKGASLTNIADRIDALGGSVAVTSSPGAGTTVHGELPAVARDSVAV
jgi:signal transduction histidine kinase